MKKLLESFFSSEYYIITLFLLSLLNWTFSPPMIVSVIIVFIIISLILLTQDNSIFLIPLILACAIANLPNTDIANSAGTATTVANFPLIFLAIICGTIVIELIYFLIKNYSKGRSFLTIGFVLITIAMFLSGNNPDAPLVTTFRYSDAISFAVITLFYLVISLTCKGDCRNYLAKSLLYFGVLISLQVFSNYYTDYHAVSAPSMKWGISNAGAIILDLTVPVSAYLFLKKFNPLHVVLYAITILGCCMTISRGGVIMILFGFVLTTIYLFKKAKYRRTLGICYLIVVGGIITALVLNKDFTTYIYTKFMSDMLKDNRFNDTGRWSGENALWPQAIAAFKEHLIFGEGTSYSPTGGQVVFYHSTVLDIMAKLGLVGCAAYLVHFFQKFLLLLHKINPFKVLVLIGVICSGIYGLMDVSYFNYIYVLVTALILCVTEKSHFEDKRIEIGIVK